MGWHLKLLTIIKEYQLAGALIGALVALTCIYINYMLQPKPIIPSIAIISKAGSLLYKSEFDKYGIFSIKKIDHEGPYYIITFNREPDYFEVSTQKGAIREITQIKIGQYKITFKVIVGGWGSFGESEPIECDFRIQAYRIR
jgi:hypothetical protein